MTYLLHINLPEMANWLNWNLYIAIDQPYKYPVLVIALMVIVGILLADHIFRAGELRTKKKLLAAYGEQLENAKLQIELNALNSHLDPHFLYNALTSLSYLVKQRPMEADLHSARLASLYRYVLINKGKPFVSLIEELQFCKDYFSIQHLRFGDAIILQVVTGNINLDGVKIIPLALQALVENALKHNRFSEQEPLVVQVHITKEQVQVSNRLQPIAYSEKSCGTGLTNLNKRMLLSSKSAIKVERSKDWFSVTVPVAA